MVNLSCLLYRFLFLAWFCFSVQESFSQSITIESIPTVCLNQESLVTYSSAATFAADNQFSIDVRANYNDAYVKSFPATVREGKLVFVLKDLGFPANILQNGLQARVTTTKPVLQSSWSNTFNLYRLATVTLTAPTVQTVNPAEPVGLQFVVDGSPSVNIVLNDSTKFTLTSSYYLNSTFTATQAVTPRATTTYRIAQVSNVCGVGSGNGAATVQVNPIGVRTTFISTNQLCIGSELRVGYSTIGGSFSAGNQFKIRLTAFTTNNRQEDLSQTFDLDAVAENGFLKATIPTTVPTLPGYIGLYYTVRVISTAPATLGDYAGYYVNLHPAPSAEFISGSNTINIGQSVFLGVKFQGQGPFSALLNEGTVLQSDIYNESGIQTRVSPLKTTTYTIKSLQTGCGPIPQKTASSVIITVNPGIAIDSVTTGAICEGQTLRMKFLQNISPGASNQYSVRIRHNSGVLSEVISAQQQGDYLTFKVPSFKLPANQTERNQSFTFQISSSQPAFSSEWQGSGSILTYPGMKWSESNVYTLEKPQQQVYWNWTGEGGAPYQIELETGETSSTQTIYGNSSTLVVPGVVSQNFRVKTIKNTCFTTANPAQATLTIKGTVPNFIYVKPYKQTVCRGDSMEIAFQATGDFAPGNQFRIQARSGSSCCTYPDTWGTTSQNGIIKFKLPTEFGWYSTGGTEMAFRIASTNPVVYSEDRSLSIHRPVYNINLSSPTTDQLLKPGTVTQTVSYLGGTPLTINYAVGASNYSLTTSPSNWYSTDISFDVLSNTTFTVKSLSNACGPVDANQSNSYKVVPYILQTTRLSGQDSFEPIPYCAGSTITLPYLTTGQPDPNISISVQLRGVNATEFRTVMTGVKTNPVAFTLPDTLQAGDYVIRLLSDLNIASANQPIRVQRKATAQLTTDTGLPTLDVSPSSSLRVNLTGSPAWTVFFNNGQRQVYSASPGRLPVTATSKTVYSLQAVANACGYGSTSGEVTVTVKPTLAISTTANAFCTNTKIPVTYKATGDFGPGNQLKIGVMDGNTGSPVRWLDSTSTTQGTFQLTLPNSFTPGSYAFKLISTNPAQETTTYFQLSTPPTVSIGGNTVINAQQSALIRVTSNQPANSSIATKYVFTTGETGEFYFWNTSYDITVRPTQTTTYRLTSVSNSCGTGQFSGSATVTVNPASDRQIITKEINGTPALCANDTVQVSFETQGAFSATNRFTVQLSDSTGSQFTDLPTLGTQSPLKGLLPASLPRGSFYRVRVRASDAGVSSAANATPLVMRYGATAAFSSSTLAFTPGKPVKLAINLTGDAPWTIRIGNEFSVASVLRTSTSPYILDLTPTATSTTYKLYQVSNGCGIGKLLDPSVITISVVTATDPAIDQHFSVYPNPTTGRVTIRQKGSGQPYTFSLTDYQGRIILQKTAGRGTDEPDLSLLPDGAYLLTVETDASTAVFRILKH